MAIINNFLVSTYGVKGVQIFLSGHLVHQLLTVTTRVFVSLVKIPVLLKISVQNKCILFVFNITNQLSLLGAIT